MSRAMNALALGVSLLIGQQAMAQSVPEPQPVPFPAGGIPTAASGNGGLLLSVYDINTPASLTLYLGLNYNDILPTTNMTSTAGLTLNFGEVEGFATLLAGSGLANLRYSVYAGDNDATGGATNTALATTGALGSSPVVLSSAVATALGAVHSFTATVNNSCGVNPCTTVDAQNALQSAFFGSPTIAPTGAVGTALGFYWLDHSGVTGPAGGANEVRYENGPTSFGQWLLSSTGNLTYSIAAVDTVVPLPAAVWLLLSGLAGFGVIGRRRAAQALA